MKDKYKFEVIYYDKVLKDMISQEDFGPDPRDTGLTSYVYYNVGE